MNRDEIRTAYFELIKTYVRELDPNAISESSLLVDDLKVNSARFVDIILETEDRFKITVSDEEMERFERVGDAVDFICERTVSV
jgi:acyl carrier protein